MTVQEALYELGVRSDTLTEAEKEKLDRDGYLPLEGIFTRDQAAEMHAVMEELFAREKTGTPEGPSECGQMQNKAPVFDICVTHPRVLAAVAHVLQGDVMSQGVHSRPNPPGTSNQGLHIDWSGPATEPGDYYVCNSIWPLADFTEENGATIVIPGSHRWARNPDATTDELFADHPQQIQLVAPVGTVVIFNSHLWHGAAANRSNAFRPNLTSYWCRRRWPHAPVGPNRLSHEAAARLSEAAQCFFDPPE
jgi:hypothetical protein